MAKIVCITSGLTGIFNASLELMHRLQLAGHTVIAAAPRPVQALASTVCSEFIKLPYYNYDPAPEVPRFAGPLRKLRRWIYKVRHAAGRKEKAMQNLGMQCFAEMISEFRADLYLVDVEMHEYIITLHHKKCPFILLSQWFSLSRDVGQAPLVTAIIPGQGWAGSKIGLWTSWQILSISRWWVFLKKRVRAAGSDRRSVLMAYARKCDFPLHSIRHNYWPGPFIYTDTTIMSMTFKELEFPSAQLQNMVYVGSMIFKGRSSASYQKDKSKSIMERLRLAKSRGAKIIYCSVSSVSKTDQTFIHKVIRAVAQKTEFELFVSLGNNGSPSNYADVPTNVFLSEWMPQLLLLRDCNLSINHGGIHTILECIHFKVPMLIYSGGKSDQDGCMARVVYHGLGMMGDRNRDTSQDIYDKILRVLRTTGFRDRVIQFNSLACRYREQRVLEKIIDDALAS